VVTKVEIPNIETKAYVYIYLYIYMYIYIYIYSRPGSSVGIATDEGLDGPGSNHGGDEI